MADKTSILKHEHPVYQWIALIVAVSMVLALAGWYVLTYQTAVDDEAISVIQSSDNVNSNATSNATEIDGQVKAINEEIDAVSSDDFSDTRLDDTSLGL